jgi:hypothetical protein
MGAFRKLRVTNETAEIAAQAARTGELVELKDRRGEVNRGWVRHCEYEFGIDKGWFVWLEYQNDFAVADLLAHLDDVKRKTLN